jgi:hypothetical protein
MKNGYFQVVCSPSGTELKILAPKEGGAGVSIKEIMEYLNSCGIMYDNVSLNKGLQDMAASGQEEYIILLNRDAHQEVRENYRLALSQDRMTLTVRFYPPSVKGERMSLEEFQKDLAFKKIQYGIKTEELRRFFAAPEYCTDIVAAEGKPPRHGTDARIEYYFQTDLSAKPTLNEDGSVDFFHLNTISSCNQGDVLARLFPADAGEPGMSVYGERINPREVKRTSLRYGRNITLSEDKQTLTADTNGHVMLVEGKVFVSNVLEVENVDNSTGNIDYEGSVRVNGNVGTNFVVKAKGNIEVKGVVEGALLEAGGNIIIARGMNGMSRGVLRAEGNVISKFIENAKVAAGGYVSTESILHSEVAAGTSISVTGRRGFITGGRVSAASLIQVKTLGSSMGADTVVEVGIDPGLKQKAQQLQKQIADNNKMIAQIHPVLSAMTQKLAQGVKLKPEQIKSLQEMLQKENQLKEAVERDTAEYESLQALMDESTAAKIEVSGEVFPGTRICISDVSMVVKNSMSYCRFTKERGDVKMSAL